ncbi:MULTISPECIES: MarR family transcriptional regulator [unclassified Shewanella]|uniref:MarR family winged helix-turn-helix transcriptional regulator n=1 Tax=unclassified Shewanella TaxID=196818 RepID=UPI0009711CFE|nr:MULTISPECIES: MarR family transcriptional regulator [unclassified Shewanella]MDO6618239.1 MarR family transcriptional regulator [Shewanella sp. 6_MG-2023]MDO6638515.1 MarR family transcriptional regulator [Shewanella sp. 5_MG-2023]MDO6677316.1 MarR family transcriptional regulator [Shewanella sp. 4_MG-2023]MDO6774337.1 MarR family transcriptional regulator [Shewanella sp. 3_MG-2023]PMG42272.1 transcriptional regulator [Shewanella sp. 10N.286.52.B9]
MEKYEELLISIRKVIRAIDLHSKQLNKKSGITGPQLMIMQEIAGINGVTASQVAKNINLSAATVTNILDRLESRNLIQRVRSEQDKRRVSLYLSDEGKACLLEAPKPLQEHFIQNFCALEEWEQSQLLSSMQRIGSMMDANELDAAPVLEVDPIYKSTELPAE